MSHHLIPSIELHKFTSEVLQRLGCGESDANDAADVLHWASLRGVDTHGFRNLVPYYANKIREGEIIPTAQIAVEHETETSARLNGGSGLGLAQATAGMQIAMRKARERGVGMVAIHNSHHLGPAGFYAHMAIDDGMLGFCTTGHFFGQGNEIGVPPLNGLMAMLSTNPLSFAAPCGRNPPFLLDMSTSVSTVNRIEMMGQRGDSIPDGWAMDCNGKPTTDPLAAKLLYPLGREMTTGGHKGMGLSMMLTVFSCVLSGAWSQVSDGARYNQPTMAHFLAAIRIDQFMPSAQFTAAMDAYVESMVQSKRSDPNLPIQYPGVREHETEAQRKRDGIPIDDRLFAEMKEIAGDLSIKDSPFS